MNKRFFGAKQKNKNDTSVASHSCTLSKALSMNLELRTNCPVGQEGLVGHYWSPFCCM